MANIHSAGHAWKEVRSKIFTPGEIAESDLRVALISDLNKAEEEIASPGELLQTQIIKPFGLNIQELAVEFKSSPRREEEREERSRSR